MHKKTPSDQPAAVEEKSKKEKESMSKLLFESDNKADEGEADKEASMNSEKG